jgi:hypothetical protein
MFQHKYVHRLAWEEANGQPVPPGMNVCHSCDNPSCCNPDHLWVGTQRENVQDAVRKGRLDTSNLIRRGEWTHCKRGHEFTPENTRINKKGARECRQCSSRRNRENWAKRRERLRAEREGGE